MNGFVFHPDAVADLNEIWEYIAADNSGAGDRVMEEIHQAIRSLVPFPQQGHRRSDLSSRPLRFYPVRDYLIAYAPDESPSLCWRSCMAVGIPGLLRRFCVNGSEEAAA